MAFKRRFSFHVVGITDAQVKTALASYVSSGGEAPTGWYQLQPGLVQVEMLLVDGKQIEQVEEKLRMLFVKVTANTVSVADELGSKGPIPETSSPFTWEGIGGKSGESFLDVVAKGLGKAEALVFLVVVGLGLFWAIRLTR